MKKLICAATFIVVLGVFSATFGDLISDLPDSYIEIQCTYESCATPRGKSSGNSFHEKRLASHALAKSFADHPSHDQSETQTSNNWSGYVAETTIDAGMPNSVTQVRGSWTIPNVLPPNPDEPFVSSSPWIGIDGWDNDSNTIQQIGTDADWQNGAPYYYVWFEMYPRQTYTILKSDDLTPFPINPGDQFSAEVIYLGTQGNEAAFLMSIVNHTQQSYAIINLTNTKTDRSPIMTSAEWILEAEEASPDNHPVANFGRVTFTDCYATINGVYGPISDPNWENFSVTMVDSSDGTTPKVETSDLDPSGTSFTVTWLQQGN